MTERAVEGEVRLELLNAYHRVFVGMLTLPGWEPDTWIGRIVRRSASRIKLWLADGIEDFDDYEVWLRCQQAVDRAFRVETVPHESAVEKRAREERIAVLTAR